VGGIFFFFLTPGLSHTLKGVGLGLILLGWWFGALFLPLALMVRFYRQVGCAGLCSSRERRLDLTTPPRLCFR
jgi:hypothetical protein